MLGLAIGSTRADCYSTVIVIAVVGFSPRFRGAGTARFGGPF